MVLHNNIYFYKNNIVYKKKLYKDEQNKDKI